MTDAKMTKSERSELAQLIRKRERVMKAQASERSAVMLAEFDAQSASIYSFNDDKVWAAANASAKLAVEKARLEIAERCREMGIPPEFAPDLNMSWYSRGQNAVAARRAELRKMAKSRIDAIEAGAKTKIERLSLNAQTEIISSGLESVAALEFLERMPPIETLMPTLDVTEINHLIDHKPGGGLS